MYKNILSLSSGRQSLQQVVSQSIFEESFVAICFKYLFLNALAVHMAPFSTSRMMQWQKIVGNASKPSPESSRIFFLEHQGVRFEIFVTMYLPKFTKQQLATAYRHYYRAGQGVQNLEDGLGRRYIHISLASVIKIENLSWFSVTFLLFKDQLYLLTLLKSLSLVYGSGFTAISKISQASCSQSRRDVCR